MKIIILSLVFSISLYASENISWNVRPTWDDQTNCFSVNNALKTETLSKQNYATSTASSEPKAPHTKLADGKIIRLPNCGTAIFAGLVENEYFAISNTHAYYSPAVTQESKRKWQTLVNYGDIKLGLSAVRFSFNPQDRVVAWVGHHGSSGMNYNYLIVWDLKNKFRSEPIAIGGGYNGMSGVKFDTVKKHIIVGSYYPSLSGRAIVQAYDYQGKDAKDFPQINNYFYKNLISPNDDWEFSMNLGKDEETGEFIYRHMPEENRTRDYRLNLDKDEVLSGSDKLATNAPSLKQVPIIGSGVDFQTKIELSGSVFGGVTKSRVLHNVSDGRSIIKYSGYGYGRDSYGTSYMDNSDILPNWDLTKCSDIQPGLIGEPVEVTVPAGTFAACRFVQEEGNKKIEKYYSNVPFGLVKFKATSTALGLSSSTVEELIKIINP